MHYNGSVDKSTIHKINALNREFYQTFSASFSSTRYRVQPGVSRILKTLPAVSTILDLGCGNGNILKELVKTEFSGSYCGVDFSDHLIRKSRQMYLELEGKAVFKADFSVFDLLQSDWTDFPPTGEWEVILAFAVLHHIPGNEMRKKLFQNIQTLLKPAGKFIFSVWQPQNSRRLVKRFQSWEQVGLTEADVEDGDILLDWKADESQSNGMGYRYVHINSIAELEKLAAETGYSIKDSFCSDGKEGNIGLYQVWEKTN